MTWLPFQKVGGDETNHYHTGNLSKGLGKEPKLCVVIMWSNFNKIFGCYLDICQSGALNPLMWRTWRVALQQVICMAQFFDAKILTVDFAAQLFAVSLMLWSPIV